MQKAMPIACPAVTSSRHVERMVFCKHYDTCLDYAVRKGWDGFSCQECHSYERELRNREQWDEDYRRCLALAWFVMYPNLKLHVCNADPGIGKKHRKKEAQTASSEIHLQ